MTLTFAYSPDEARDDHGKWTSGGGDGASPATGAVRNVASGYASKARGLATPGLQARADKLSSAMGGRLIDLTGVDPKLQEGVMQSMERFHATYPDVRFEVANVDPHSAIGRALIEDPGRVLASTTELVRTGTGTSTIALNGNFYSDAQTYQRAVKDSVANGFLAWGSTTPGAMTMDHELGHALANHLVTVDPDGYTGTMVGILRDVDPGSVHALSQYATTNGPELIGESAANVQSAEPSALARTVMSRLTDLYQRNAR